MEMCIGLRMDGWMGAHGVYRSREKGVKELGWQQRRGRVRQRRGESFLQPATRDITVFLLRGFSLVRKNSFVCVCVRVCVRPAKPQHVSTAGTALRSPVLSCTPP